MVELVELVIKILSRAYGGIGGGWAAATPRVKIRVPAMVVVQSNRCGATNIHHRHHHHRHRHLYQYHYISATNIILVKQMTMQFVFCSKIIHPEHLLHFFYIIITTTIESFHILSSWSATDMKQGGQVSTKTFFGQLVVKPPMVETILNAASDDRRQKCTIQIRSHI